MQIVTVAGIVGAIAIDATVGWLHSFWPVAVMVIAIVLGEVLADQLATRLWGQPRPRKPDTDADRCDQDRDSCCASAGGCVHRSGLRRAGQQRTMPSCPPTPGQWSIPEGPDHHRRWPDSSRDSLGVLPALAAASAQRLARRAGGRSG